MSKWIMNIDDVNFDDNFEFYTRINESEENVCIVLADYLEVVEQTLPDEYKLQIAEFINDSSTWYQAVFGDISKWVEEEYSSELKLSDIQLMNIFVLFEPHEPELYGLQFRLLQDIEHGCGLKVCKDSNNKDSYKVVEIGSADVAFC